MKKNKRIQWIDYVKAFACFLVVLGHLLQSLQKANIDNNIEITSFINWFIYLFHMPLFMCMSGFLYLKNKMENTLFDYKKFELRKIINLIVPYVTFYLIFISINIIFSSSVNNARGIKDVLNIFNNPMPPYWFLYALLSIFIVVPILEKVFKYNSKVVLGIFVLLKIISFFLLTRIYFIDSIMKYGIYFYIACIFMNDKFDLDLLKILSLVFIYIITSIIYYVNCENLNNFAKEILNLIFAINGIIIVVNCFRKIKKSIFLDTFKKYTFEIYLTHTIFAAGIRIVLLKSGITNYLVHFIIGMTFSIYVPILMSIISKKIGYTEFFFYPIKTINYYKERKKINE